MQNWFLIYTKPRSEDTVSNKFVDRGLEVLNPKLKAQKFIRRMFKEIISPLFPCYIFVKFHYPQDYYLVKYTRGVRSIIGTDKSPTIVHDDIINSIWNKTEKNPIITIKPSKFKSGEGVKIKSGLFEGFNAIFEKELKGVDRVRILLASHNARLVLDGALLGKQIENAEPAHSQEKSP